MSRGNAGKKSISGKFLTPDATAPFANPPIDARRPAGSLERVYLWYTWVMAATTIKVSSQTRDQINELAAAQGLTAGGLVEKVLADYLWRQQVAAAKQQMLDAPAEVWAAYLKETGTLDGAPADGLMADPW